MRRFDQELSELHHQLIEMGTLAESMVTTAVKALEDLTQDVEDCLLYTSPSPRDATLSRMPSSA